MAGDDQDLQEDDRQEDVRGPCGPRRTGERGTCQPEVRGDDQYTDRDQDDRRESTPAFPRRRFGCRFPWVLPVHFQAFAPADRFEAMSDGGLQPLQAVLVGGFEAQRQHIGGGLDGAPARADVDGSVGVGPFDVLHLGRGMTAAPGWPVAAGPAHAEIRDRAGDAGERLEAVLVAYALITHETRGHHDSELAALVHRDEHLARPRQQLVDMIRNLLAEGAGTGDIRDDVTPDELAIYCLHALDAAGSLRSTAAVHRLVTVTLTGLRPRST